MIHQTIMVSIDNNNNNNIRTIKHLSFFNLVSSIAITSKAKSIFRVEASYERRADFGPNHTLLIYI